MMSTLYYEVHVDTDEKIEGNSIVGIVHNHSITLPLCHSFTLFEMIGMSIEY